MKGALWIVGIFLLIAMFVGVRLLIHNTAASADVNKDGPGAPDRIIAWGNFDVEKGVAMLYPRQFGNVVYVHPESTKVRKGEPVRVKKDEVLLQVDDGLAQLKVLEAEADVLAGEQQLAEARTLPELYKLQNEQQEAAVKAVALDIDKTKADRDSKLLSVSDSPQLSKKLTEYYQFALDQLAQKKIAEEAKLKQVKLQNAELKIKQAEADLTAKKVRVKEAKVAVSYYKIVAPSDGYVLRVLSREGETLGSNPRTPALEFVTDAPIVVRAEVLQEWGRYVKPGAEVVIEDDTYKGPTWDGVVKSVSSWYATTRSPIIEPFRYNDVRTLECIIEVTKGDTPKFIGQRVRAKIKIEK